MYQETFFFKSGVITFLLNMIVTIIQSCIYIKHEVCRTVRPEIGSRCFLQFSIVTFILVAMVIVKDIRIYKNINEHKLSVRLSRNKRKKPNRV